MDDIKRKVLQELMSMMDEKMGEKLKGKKPMKPEMEDSVVLQKEEEQLMLPKEMAKVMPEMSESEDDSEDEDKKRLFEMYSKLS